MIRATRFIINKQIINTLLLTLERLRELRDKFSFIAH